MAMESPASRLRWARSHDGRFKTATDAARAFGWPVSTYLGHENGDRVPSRPTARRYAKAYRVRWEWLLEGEGSPTEKVREAPVVGEVSAAAEIKLYPKGSKHRTAELPPGSSVLTVAVEVLGGSMRGIADEHWLIYFDHEQRPPTADLVGKLCVVELADGRVFVRVLAPGRKRGHYDLELPMERTLRDQKVVSAARVTWIKPR